MKLLYVVSGLGLLTACVIGKPIDNSEFDEDCAEEMDQPLEVDYESVQKPEILPAYGVADLTMEFGDYGVEEEADCAEDLPATTPEAEATMEPDYECEEEEFELPALPEENNIFEAAYDTANDHIQKDYDLMFNEDRVVEEQYMDTISEECEEVEAEPLEEDYVGEFGFANNYDSGYIEESQSIIVNGIAEEAEALEVEECEE